jgi:hypothetical protein
MAAPLILVEARPRRVDTGAEVIVRLAGGGGVLPYFYAGEHWYAGIQGLPRIVASIDYAGTDLGGGSVPQAMVLGWVAGSAAALAEKAELHWSDAAITVRVGPEGALPPVLTSGKVLSATTEGGVLRIALADPAADLKKPILTDRYAGTGGLEGPVEWEGKLKRRAWGRLFNVAGDCIDAANSIYCYADPTRPLQGFDAVRDKGAPALAAALVVLGWQGSAAATLAALKAAAVPQGGGVLCPSIACLKWWTQPAGALCVDLRGEVGAGYVETAASVAKSIAGAVSATPFAAGTVEAANYARPIAVGWLAESEDGTAAAAIDQLLGDVSLLWILDADHIVIRRWEWGASVATARSQSVTRTDAFKPVKIRRLGYRQNHNVMSRDSIAAIVLVSDIAFESGDTLQTTLDDLYEDVTNAQGDALQALEQIAQVDGDQQITAIQQVIAASNAEIGRLRDRARLFAGGDGADVKTLLRRESDARRALAMIVTTAAAALSGVSADVQQLLEAFSDGETGYARFLLRAEVDEDGVPTSIVGIEGMAGAGSGVLRFVADVIQLVHPVTGNPAIYFDTDTGKIIAHSVEVDTLKVNTAIIPARSSVTLAVPGLGTSTWITVLTAAIIMPVAGWVEASAALAQGFGSGDQEWHFELIIDGVTVQQANGGRTQDNVPLADQILCDAGFRAVSVRWRGHSSIALGNRSLSVKGYPKTE